MPRLSSKCSVAAAAAAVLLILVGSRLSGLEAATAPGTGGGGYCAPSLCQLYNGSHVVQVPHTACGNNGSFGAQCGNDPKILAMNDRRRQLLLDMHNLARSKIASGELAGYKSATHMPLLRWDGELEQMAGLHAKRCQFAHDKCRNTPRFQFSGQNIGYFWIGREFKSHSRRMKSFVLNWFREYLDANQTFIDSYRPHPQGKKIGHFTLLVSDRVHRVGCAAVRFLEPQASRYQFMLTCNYDYNNIYNEPIYQSGPAASKCIQHHVSDKFPALCDWRDAAYDYDSDESAEDGNTLDNNIPL
ncbi:antigen 5 like allergen Cul n 1 [Drosophila pseudoobscura]|uniref:Venom allergen-1 n=1 Tax=Drosophila pseudoobscura pseudoobscura TaxID=46245 RepID=A0A6I8UFV6_DROPS|nr:antigen 5 like allergen Cul n 1 [Drosophila pseudoobscura]